jgi:uncharacterized cupin superfamily protein
LIKPKNKEQKQSSDVLDRCINLRIGEDCNNKVSGRQQRIDELVATFGAQRRSAMECAVGWYFCVPGSFRAALDIGLTPRMIDGKSEMRWTQGSWFHFEEGDKIYDSVKAYKAWNPKNIQICLDIRKASPAKPASAKGDPRIAGTVILDVLMPNEMQTQLEKRKQVVVTQDEFVRILIVGPPDEWEILPTKAVGRNGVIQGNLPF